MNEHLVIAIFISIFLVFITTAIFFEILRIVLRIIAKHDFRPRPLMYFLVMFIFTGHTIAVWVYGFTYWFAVHYLGFDALNGIEHDSFFGYVYFSAATYSSLGIGDVFPHGAMRMIAGVEVLNGLMLIGWSVMFTYFAVQKLWDLHIRNNKSIPMKEL